MARPRTCRNPRRNPPPDGKDEGGPPRTPTKGSNTSTYSLAVIRTLTPAPTSTNKLFKRFMKAYLESNQRPSQPPKERKRLFKAMVPDVCYGKLQIDCNHFCQQCKDYFETSWATRTNQTPFAASFLCGNISVQ